uniref:FMRFamide receptor n=1 Tax=Magallana gigas TaxID=29159 RepID=K1QTX7_MAGGI
MVRGEINFALNLSYGDAIFLQDSAGNNTALQNAFYMQYVVNGIILPILSVFGVFGNILTMVVLWRREMHSTTILFLRALVLTDTGIIVVVALTVTPFTLSFFHPGLWYFKDVIYPNVFTPVTYIVMVIQQCNVWITVSTPGLFSQFDFLFDPIVFIQWIAFGNTLFVTNSSVNFLIYTAVGRRFRKVLLKMFKKIFGQSVFSRSRNSGSSSDHELLETLRSTVHYRDSEVTQVNDIHKLEKIRLTS